MSDKEPSKQSNEAIGIKEFQMVKKRAHPDTQLFDYLNGAADKTAAKAIEAHLSECDDCASAVVLVRALKIAASETTPETQSSVSTLKSQISREHPDISELASFFYAKSQHAAPSSLASHLALCSPCAEAIAQYARAEGAAAEYKPTSVTTGAVPAKAWEMIRDWENSSFATLKPASEVLGQELLDRLTHLLSSSDVNELESGASRPESAERVPVLIVTSSGEMRGVEFFERELDSSGASVLKHSEGSARFDNKPLHTLFDFGENSFVASNLIRRDTIRLEQARPEEQSRRTDYIIIED